MSFQLRLTSIVTLISAATLLSGCGGGRGGSSALPSLAMTPVATSGGDPTAQAAAATTAAQTVAALGTALPHVSLDADLAALAPAMVASGKFSSAQVVPGGISAQLPDGTPFAVFADHADDPTSSGASSAARSAAARVRASRALPSAQHLIAFLVNTTDQRGAFNPAHQQDYANALSALALGQAPYATAVSDVQLDSIAAFGSAQRLDLLDISTHGMVIYDSANKPHYVMLSDTQISPAAMQAYRDELKAGRVVSSTLIAAGYSRRSVFNPSGTATPTPVPPVYANLASLAFTPGFLTEHLAFNPGAVVLNESCYGQSPTIASAVTAAFGQPGVGVGRYYGWDDKVIGASADETDAFIFDRLVGEGSTLLGNYVTQQSPPQRPLPLDDIWSAMSKETRNGPLETDAFTYRQSQLTGGTMQVSDLGGETVSNPPIVYALPSIARMEIVETSSGGTLTIFGRFPPQTGLVKVSDGTNSQTIIPSSWSTSQVVVTLPVAGLGSYGNVYVISTDGISSNAAPLTKWTGTITGVQNDTFTYMPGNAYATGTGTGTIVTSFTFDFRADVHPTVPSIDASPVPQNLYFAQPEADSVAQITSLTGSFTTSSSSTTSGSAAFGLSASAAPMPPAPPPIPDGTFGFGALPGQPATCNNGQPGPQPGPTNVFCAGIGYSAPSAGTCSNTGANPICASALWKATWVFGDPTRKDDGLLQLTMDPTTYAITLSATTATKADNNFESFPTSKTTLSGTIGPPMSPPNPLLPATVRRSMH